MDHFLEYPVVISDYPIIQFGIYCLYLLLFGVDCSHSRYVQMIESDVADGLTQHQRAEDGRYGRISNCRQTIRDLSLPPHLFSQLNQHRDGLDFLRTSGHLSKIFTVRCYTHFFNASNSYSKLLKMLFLSRHIYLLHYLFLVYLIILLEIFPSS